MFLMSGVVEVRTRAFQMALHRDRHQWGEVAGSPNPILACLQILDIFGNGIHLLPLTIRYLAPHNDAPIFLTVALLLRDPRVEGPAAGAPRADVAAVRPHSVMGPGILDDGELGGGFVLLGFKVEVEEGRVACDEYGLIKNSGDVVLRERRAFNKDMVDEVVEE